MKIAKQFEIMLPEWAIPPLEYNDYSGLDDNDTKALDAFVESLMMSGLNLPTFVYNWESEENGFYHFPAFGLGCNCIKTTILYFEN